MFSHPERLIIALMIALLFAGVTLVAAEASSQPSMSQQSELPCEGCHAQFMEEWQNGPHGQATSDPVFNEAWEAQGKPGNCLVCHTTGYDPDTGTWVQDGITCEACHGPIPDDHPKSPAPIDRSPILCGSCHSSARFEWEEWQTSAHYKRDMTCINCHDPHQATLKQVPPDGSEIFADTSHLCTNCHSEYTQSYTHSTHFGNDITCIDCHLVSDETHAQHTIHDHNFKASLAACNTCHAEQMHDGENQEEHAGIEQNHEIDLAVTSEPKPVSPLGFAGLASLIGIAAGTVLAPWLEEKYKAFQREGRK